MRVHTSFFKRWPCLLLHREKRKKSHSFDPPHLQTYLDSPVLCLMSKRRTCLPCLIWDWSFSLSKFQPTCLPEYIIPPTRLVPSQCHLIYFGHSFLTEASKTLPQATSTTQLRPCLPFHIQVSRKSCQHSGPACTSNAPAIPSGFRSSPLSLPSFPPALHPSRAGLHLLPSACDRSSFTEKPIVPAQASSCLWLLIPVVGSFPLPSPPSPALLPLPPQS